MAAILSFQKEISAVRDTSVVAELKARLTGLAYEMSSAYMGFTDALSAHLGAQAANECARSCDQELAITRCESFVSDEVSCDELMLAAAVVVMNDPQELRELVGRIANEAPARAGTGMAP